MKLTEDEVFQILKLLKESHFDELNLEMGDLKLHVRKSGRPGSTGGECVAITSTQMDVFPKQEVSQSRVQETPSVGAEARERGEMKVPEEVAPIPEEGLLKIPSPMLGTFYRRPAPGSPPYVEVDTFVKEDDTVCLLEVMKVFNSVKAGVRGYVVKICADSGDLVEYGQTLFLVKPAERLEEKK
jgi:acetyl-CoA carboxylase biotin carboxyl carrier protein